MNILFICALIVICSTIPFWIIVILLYIFKLFINISFKISGIYNITNISLGFSNDEFTINLKLDSIKILLRWPRIRLLFQGLKITFKINKSDFQENNQILKKKKINDFSFIKEKYSEILKSISYNNNKNKNNLLTFNEIQNIDDMVKHKKTSIKNRLILYILRFFDVYIEKIKFTLQFDIKNVFYSIFIRKIIAGAIKSPNKKSEIDIVGAVYDLEIREHIGKNKDNIDNHKEFQTKMQVYKRYISKNIYINKYKNSKNIKYRIIKLCSLGFKIAFLEGFFPQDKSFSISNNLRINIEGKDLNANISKRAVDNIISLIIGLIVSINNNKENNTIYKEMNEDSPYNDKNLGKEDIVCVEQILLKKLNSELKRMEIKIQNLNVNLFNDNYLYKYLTIKCNHIKIERNSVLYMVNNVNNDLHLIKREMELHFIEIQIFQFRNKKLFPVTQVPFFDLSIKDNIIYNVINQNAELITNISGRLSDVELIISTQNVNRLIELTLTIVDGIDIIEYIIKAKRNIKYNIDKEFKDTSKIEINLERINAHIYNKEYYSNLTDLGIQINMDAIKGVSKLITLNFLTVNFSFSPTLENSHLNNFFTSHIILDGFKISIEDHKANGGERYYNLYFPDSLFLTSERHLLKMLKFVSEIAAFILNEEVEKKIKKKVGKHGIIVKKRARNGTKLVFNKIEGILLMHEEDLIHIFLEDFVYLVNEQLIFPKASMYHNTVLKKNNLFHKFIDIENFSISFLSDSDLNLSCEDFRINYYEAYISRPIIHIIFFFQYFAEWLNYYFTYKFLLDENSQLEKYELMKDKVVTKKFMFSKFQFDINDYPIASAAILKINKDELENNMKSIISFLKKKKVDLLTIVFKGINIETTYIFKVTRNLSGKGNYNFYNRILINSKIEINIPNTNIDLEGKEIINMGNFIYRSKTNRDWYNFDPNEILTQILIQDRNVIIKKKISFETNLDNELIIKQDNIQFTFQDVIVFDKTLTFIIKIYDSISKISINQCFSLLLIDKITKSLNKVTYLSVNGINGKINSVDPKTQVIYNTLDIKVKEISYLKELYLERVDKTEKVEHKKDGYELSLHYLLFGFTPSQKSGFPLFSLPLCELNNDNVNKVLKINFPTDIPPDPYSYSSMFTDIYNEELNELIIKTKSLTIFLNYQYIDTFYKIFNVFWSKTSLIRKGNSKENKPEKEIEVNSVVNRRNVKLNTTTTTKSSSYIRKLSKSSRKLSTFGRNSDSKKQKSNFKLILFDLKIIYLLEYKNEYKNIFSFHKFVEEHKYFGYIFRIYSFNLEYEKNNSEQNDVNKMKSNLDFLTISFLDIDNLSDEPFFVKDSELKSSNFRNLKDINEYNNFMQLNENNKSKILNLELDKFSQKNGFKIESKQLSNNSIDKSNEIEEKKESNEEYIDLPFDYRHTFIKISEFVFKRVKNTINKENVTQLNILNSKISWNKFNKDVLFLIIFKDLFLIFDKIFLKDSKEEDKDEKAKKEEKNDIIKKKTSTLSKSKNEKIIKIEDIKEKEEDGEEDEGEENEEEEDEEEKNEKEDGNRHDISTFNFEFKNPQFVVQDEIKGSSVLLSCKEPIIIVFDNYMFCKIKKYYGLKIICKQLGLYSLLKSDKKSSVIYWMGDPKENKYHLSDDDFVKIIESPIIDFNLSQEVKKPDQPNELNLDKNSKIENLAKKEHSFDKSTQKLDIEEYEIVTTNTIRIDKITGMFNSTYFDDFLNIVGVLIFDRGFSFSQEKNSDSQMKKDMKKYKNSVLQIKIKKALESTKISDKLKSRINFTLNEVTFTLCEDVDTKNKKPISKSKKNSLVDIFKPLLQFQMKKFTGHQEIRVDKSSVTNLEILQLDIKNVEHEMSQPVFQPEFDSKPKDLENKMNILGFKKRDRYVKLETNSLWYVLDEFEIIISPFAFKITKKQISFILNFFFHNDDKEKKKKKNEQKDEELIPWYFTQFKINDIKCLLNFEYAEAHPLNVPTTRLKFNTFIKNEKFYPLKAMISRFLGHCKKELLQNTPNIISGVFSKKDCSSTSQDVDEEALKRKLLFGDK